MIFPTIFGYLRKFIHTDIDIVQELYLGRGVTYEKKKMDNYQALP